MTGRRLTPTLVALTVALAALVTATSLLGLLAPWTYANETADWRAQAQGQDIGNLLAVFALLAGAWRGRRGSRRGRQVWLGALLYLAYAFAIYAFTLHFGRLFLAYIAVLGLSAYGLLFGSSATSAEMAPREHRAGGWVVTGIAVLFALLWLGAIVPAMIADQAPSDLAATGLPANPVHVLDLALVLPGMVITAGLARRGPPTAGLMVVPWLVFSTLMGASIVATLLLTSAPLVPLLAVGAVTITAAASAAIELGRPGRTGLDTVRETLRIA